MNIQAVVINPKDNVATVVEDIAAQTEIHFVIGDKGFTITAIDNIPLGHKVAIAGIGAKEPILKYGESIGRATQNIEVGQHVHVHNMESQRGRGDLNQGGVDHAN